MVAKRISVMKLVSTAKLVSIGLVAFSFLMLLLPFLPTGYSSMGPNQLGCVTTTTTVTGTSELVTTSTTTGSTASTATITVGTTTHLLETVTCDTGNLTETVVTEVNVLLGLVITIPAVIVAEYPYGVALVAIFMIIAYGVIRRKTATKRPN